LQGETKLATYFCSLLVPIVDGQSLGNMIFFYITQLS
jgi:hypothetical protein